MVEHADVIPLFPPRSAPLHLVAAAIACPGSMTPAGPIQPVPGKPARPGKTWGEQCPLPATLFSRPTSQCRNDPPSSAGRKPRTAHYVACYKPNGRPQEIAR